MSARLLRYGAPAAGAAVGLAVALVAWARGNHASPQASATSAVAVAEPHKSTAADTLAQSAALSSEPLVVHRADADLKIDGELEEPSWQTRLARTGPLHDSDGTPSRPYSDVRLLWRGDVLYLALYAADEMIHTTGPTRDLFHVTVGDKTFDVDATGKLEGAPRGTSVAVDRDGEIDDDKIDDEEWVVELALPLKELGLAPGASTKLVVDRCDTPRDGKKRCGSWSGTIQIEESKP